MPPSLASPDFSYGHWDLDIASILLTDITPQTQPFPHSNQKQGTLSLLSSVSALLVAFRSSSLSLPTLVCLGVLRIALAPLFITIGLFHT